MSPTPHASIRVEKGRADDTEIAALTAVLFARAAAIAALSATVPGKGRAPYGRRGPRHPGGFRGAASWQR